jgi:Autophagocytosis associated protein, active-site domain
LNSTRLSSLRSASSTRNGSRQLASPNWNVPPPPLPIFGAAILLCSACIDGKTENFGEKAELPPLLKIPPAPSQSPMETGLVSRVLHGIAESVAPTLKKSELTTRGVLTPGEFVAAGDALVSKFPSWRWAAGDAAQRRSYLPSERQYLVTKSGAWRGSGACAGGRRGRVGGVGARAVQCARRTVRENVQCRAGSA